MRPVWPGSSVVEQWTENPRVGSSILPPATTLNVIKKESLKTRILFVNRSNFLVKVLRLMYARKVRIGQKLL